MVQRRGRPSRRARSDEGVALVEFAFIAPILFLLIFGIIEFGWAFYQRLDVRHGAREASRLAAVNYQPTGVAAGAAQRDAIIIETCERMDDNSDATITLSRTGGDLVGATVTVNVNRQVDTLTGVLDFALPDPYELDSTVKSRMEQDATWASGSRSC